MNTAIRVLAICDGFFAVVGLYFAGYVLPQFDVGGGWGALLPLWWSVLLVALTFLLSLALAVLTLIAVIQQKRHRWLLGFIAVYLMCLVGPVVFAVLAVELSRQGVIVVRGWVPFVVFFVCFLTFSVISFAYSFQRRTRLSIPLQPVAHGSLTEY